MEEKYNEESYKAPSPWWLFAMITIICFLIVAVNWDKFSPFKDTKNNTLTLIGGFLVFLCGFIQYRIGQEWKKTEFLAQEYKSFIEDRYVQRVMYLLDYPISSFQLFEDENNLTVKDTECKEVLTGQKIIVGCSYAVMKDALSNKYDDEAFSDFNAKANIIRFSFDKFLFKLGLFQKLIDSDLIKAEDLKHYLFYWIDFIKKTENPKLNSHSQDFKDMKKELIRFMKRYDYSSLNNLVKNFGTDIDQLCRDHGICP